MIQIFIILLFYFLRTVFHVVEVGPELPSL